jgi:acyl carrier protein
MADVFERYKNIFISTFSLEEGVHDLVFNAIPEWDSVGHMGLIAALEEEFQISFNTDDIIDFDSFRRGVTIIKKYGVDIELE